MTMTWWTSLYALSVRRGGPAGVLRARGGELVGGGGGLTGLGPPPPLLLHLYSLLLSALLPLLSSAPIP
jgi:hypothetical protein